MKPSGVTSLVVLVLSFACLSGCTTESKTDVATATSTSSTPGANAATSGAVQGKEELPSDFPISLDRQARKVEMDEIEEHEQKFDILTSLTLAEAEAFYRSEFSRIGWQVVDGAAINLPVYEKHFTASSAKKSVLVLLAKDGSGSKVHFNFSDHDDDDKTNHAADAKEDKTADDKEDKSAAE
jgi:hypothetical protein